MCINKPVNTHRVVGKSSLPNYIGCMIPVFSFLNIPRWHIKLNIFPDKQLVDFLEFGWTIGSTANICHLLLSNITRVLLIILLTSVNISLRKCYWGLLWDPSNTTLSVHHYVYHLSTLFQKVRMIGESFVP